MMKAAGMVPSGFKRPTKATIIAAKPYPGEILGVSCPIGPQISITPANPAKAPERSNTK